MFQGFQQGAAQLVQGATLYILNRKTFTVNTGSIVAVSQPHISKAAQGNPALAFSAFVVDVTVSIGTDTQTIEFPVNSTSANYPDKGWYVSVDNLSVSREVETMVNNSKQFMSQVPWNQMVIEKGEPLLLQLNPEKKVEAEQAQKIAALENQIAQMNGYLQQLVGKLPANPRNENTKE